ncbi:MAG: LPXTG cell wall anchor domain-containing protein, partial [Oscillospiraceae bacterium]|nr:LPXTG cell wall anchor domain-containing protein [Oscillospiraceae bacterium]
GKTLTLKANFLNLLNYGTYTMKLDTNNGGTETTTFRIVTANYAPATGDESNLAIWVAVMIISGVGAIALIPRRKKEM